MSMIKVSQNCGTYQDKPHNLEVFTTKKNLFKRKKIQIVTLVFLYIPFK